MLRSAYDLDEELAQIVRSLSDEEVRALVQALNPAELPFLQASGKELSIREVRFTWSGPARKLRIGMALKPYVYARGWENGANVVSPYFTHTTVINVPEYVTPTPISLVLSPPYPGFPVPYPGDYTCRGGGKAVFFSGGCDTWVWLSDQTAIEAEGLVPDASALMNEKYIMIIDTDADVVSLYLKPAASNLQVRYAIA